MSNPTPVAKPGNTDNPRVFFDVDIGGERGQDLLFFFRKAFSEWLHAAVFCHMPVSAQKKDRQTLKSTTDTTI